jgi:hypothetical protein
MASRRWVITTPPPKTVTCPGCRKSRNRLSVYPTFEGKSCYSCLTSSPAADVAAAMAAAPDNAKPIAVPVTPSVRPTTCPEAGCGRLPAHKGDHRATLRRQPKAVVQSTAYAVGA